MSIRRASVVIGTEIGATFDRLFVSWCLGGVTPSGSVIVGRRGVGVGFVAGLGLDLSLNFG
ncbi:hypothetical protein FJY68_14020 [candidate division WOR-3 bacterium]|uniref:Uncharacterized protein n=1 Tax=candidate division WOR-3 bacterium TaxID=2052148 RepID=A0A938BUE4_UNCW3|nr:hypothetical protein [candidate division WOR-3 bacterium]